MKIAFVHDRILTIGGGEKVFFDLINQEDFEVGEIFTIFSDKNEIKINNKIIKINSIINNKFIIKKIDYRNLMPIYPILCYFLSKKISKFKPNKIVISSFAIAKNINNNGYKKLYLHSPMQYIRDSYDEYINKFKGIKKIIFKIVSKYLRIWDKNFTKYDEIYFNSYYTKNLANKIYGINGNISYPKIEKTYFEENLENKILDYFIYIGRIVKFSKNVDLIIELFNKTGDNLIIAGSGPDEEYLMQKAKGNIKFVGYIDNKNEKINLIKMSRGLINITKESFGISTAEALIMGVPVFGYNEGATPELVDKNSGILIPNKETKTIEQYFDKFKKTNFDRKYISTNFKIKYNKISK